MKPESGKTKETGGVFWPLRTIAALSAVVFVTGFCLEVMLAYQIKSHEQHLLIVALLASLSVWALVELRLIKLQDAGLPLHGLRLVLLLQLACALSRGVSIHFFPAAAVDPTIYRLAGTHDLSSLIYPAAYIAVFLGVGNAIINLLLHNEQVRAGLLEVLNRRLEIEATHDALTGLPTRRVFRDRLAHDLMLARRDERIVAVIFLDLDGFKPVNDRYGHEAGDLVLKAVSQRWKTCIRETDLLARLGGDEFAISIGNLSEIATVEPIAQALIDALIEEIRLADGRHCQVGVSLGISFYPSHGSDVDALLASADGAMYASKNAGKNRFAFA